MRAGKAGRLAAIVAAFAGTLATAGPAHATRVALFGPNERAGISGEIQISGTSGANRIEIEYESTRGTFLISDPSGVTSRHCVRLARTRVRCTSPADSSLTVSAREGKDEVRIARGVRTGARVSGGSGDDQIIGGRFADDLFGDGGDDVMFGKGGDDDLGGYRDLGHDEFYAGPGNDDVDASEQRSGADLVINCGAGRLDDAFVDKGRDPRPSRCEDVIDT